MSEFIPYSDLKKGLEIIKRNVKSLIDTASLLFQNRGFVHSAIFSIIAIEEIAKAQLLDLNYKQKRDVPYSEWNRIVGRKAHYKKIQKLFANSSCKP